MRASVLSALPPTAVLRQGDVAVALNWPNRNYPCGRYQCPTLKQTHWQKLAHVWTSCCNSQSGHCFRPKSADNTMPSWAKWLVNSKLFYKDRQARMSCAKIWGRVQHTFDAPTPLVVPWTLSGGTGAGGLSLIHPSLRPCSGCFLQSNDSLYP